MEYTESAPDTTTSGTRPGPRPRTSLETPHSQLDQFSPEPVQAELWHRMSGLPGVVVGASRISLPSSRALHLPDEAARGPREAFIVEHEFAHLHGDGSGSLHLALPPAVVDTALAGGWGEPHPTVALGLMPATLVMLYGPRDEAELAIIWELVRASHAQAVGGTHSD